MNNRKKQQEEQDQIQETKAREQKIRDFQAMQVQQVSTPGKAYGLRNNAASIKTPSQNSRIPILTPGKQAIPVKKTKHEAVGSPLPSQSPMTSVRGFGQS